MPLFYQILLNTSIIHILHQITLQVRLSTMLKIIRFSSIMYKFILIISLEELNLIIKTPLSSQKQKDLQIKLILPQVHLLMRQILVQ